METMHHFYSRFMFFLNEENVKIEREITTLGIAALFGEISQEELAEKLNILKGESQMLAKVVDFITDKEAKCK